MASYDQWGDRDFDDCGAPSSWAPAVDGWRLSAAQAAVRAAIETSGTQIPEVLDLVTNWPDSWYPCLFVDGVPAAVQEALAAYTAVWLPLSGYAALVAAFHAVDQTGWQAVDFARACRAQGVTPPKWAVEALEAQEAAEQAAADAEEAEYQAWCLANG